MRFDTWSLVAALALAVLATWGIRARWRGWTADARAFEDDADAGGVALERPWAASRGAARLRTVVLVLLAIAAADPHLPGRDASARDRDLVVVLDVSMSMRAADITPSRLDEAKRQVAEAVASLAARRVALVAFAAEPALVCPPTVDRGAFIELLDATTEEVAPAGPSNASLALARAIELLPAQGGDVLVLSDGEFPDEDRARLAAIVTLARRRGVRVSTVTVGTEAGELVPLRGSRPPQPALDDAGRPLVTRADAAVLAWLGGQTGGRASRLDAAGRIDPATLLAYATSPASETSRALSPFGPFTYYGYPLALALLLLVGDAWGGQRDARRRAAAGQGHAASAGSARSAARAAPAATRTRRLATAGSLLLLLAATPTPAAAQAHVAAVREGNVAMAAGRVEEAIAHYRRALDLNPASGVAHANLGVALARAGRLEPALAALATATERLTGPGDLARVHYDLGTVLARLGRLDEALRALRTSLRLRDDPDARFNYALVYRWREAQGRGPAPDEPLDPERAAQLREHARALDVPVVKRPSASRLPPAVDR